MDISNPMDQQTGEPIKKNNPVYFAAEEDPTKVASVVLERGASFFNLLRSNAYLEKIN